MKHLIYIIGLSEQYKLIEKYRSEQLKSKLKSIDELMLHEFVLTSL